MMQTCAYFEVLLARHAVGGLDAGDAAELDAHLATCPDCLAVLATLTPRSEVASTSGDDLDLPEIGDHVYDMGEEIARGGMGRVRSARDRRIGRPVAIKELLDMSPDLVRRFEREARMTARLQHPGIVPIYEIGRWHNGKLFYAMRNVAGRTLREAIRVASTFPQRLALLPAVTAAAEALAYAHGSRVIHRDLTPANIIVGTHGETVVIDWGLAKYLLEDNGEDEIARLQSPAGKGESILTQVGDVMGTPAYMPPEQARGEPVDERADVYALGAIMYHVLAGRPPYRGAGASIVQDVLQGEYVSLGEVEPSVPRDLLSIVAKAMARRPDDRYPTARELADELTTFQSGRLVSSHAYSPLELVTRWANRNRALVTTSVLAIIVIVIGGIVGARRILQESNATKRTAAMLLEDQGRQELLDGNAYRALAYLAAAYQDGDASDSLRLLLGMTLRVVEPSELTLARDRSVVRQLHFSPDRALMLVVAERELEVWRLRDQERVLRIPSKGELDEGQWSTDGRLLLSRDHAGHSAKIWDAASGKLVCEITRPPATSATRSSFQTVTRSSLRARINHGKSGTSPPAASSGRRLTMSHRPDQSSVPMAVTC